MSCSPFLVTSIRDRSGLKERERVLADLVPVGRAYAVRRRTMVTVRNPSERASWRTSRPTVNPASVCVSPSPGCRRCSTMVNTQAVTGLTMACAASSSDAPSGTGTTRSNRAHDQLAPGAPYIQRDDACARRGGGDAGAECLHGSDAFDSRAGRKSRLTTETSAQDVKVGRVDGRQAHAHEHLARSRHRIGPILDSENVRRLAVALEDECLHGVLLSVCRLACVSPEVLAIAGMIEARWTMLSTRVSTLATRAGCIASPA